MRRLCLQVSVSLFLFLFALRSFPFPPNFWRESLERIFFILVHLFFILFGGISCNLYLSKCRILKEIFLILSDKTMTGKMIQMVN